MYNELTCRNVCKTTEVNFITLVRMLRCSTAFTTNVFIFNHSRQLNQIEGKVASGCKFS